MERWQPRGRGRGRGRGRYSSSSFGQSNDSGPSKASNHARKTTTNRNDAEDLPNLIGTCPFMCPIEERTQRERLRDLAIFERLNGNPSKSSSTLAVKKFCRTISSKDLHNVDLRPLPVLQHTLNHLLTIFESKEHEHPFEAVHDFVFDRTRSIRQDLSMQNIITGHQAVNIYEQIVKFHIISQYKLRRNSSNSNALSPMHHLNMEQLTKTLTSLYHLYDTNRTSSFTNEAEFYSFYVLLHLDSNHQPTGESLSLWFKTLPFSIIKSKEMMFTRKLLRCFRFGNYKSFLHYVETEASCLQYYVLEPYICEIRAFGLGCLNHGGYKLNPYPLLDICKVLIMEECDVESFCKDCGLDTFVSDEGVKFMPTKQTSFCYPKGSQRYYPLVSNRLKKFYDEAFGEML